MRRSKSLERLRTGKAVQICSLGHFIPPFVCHAAEVGFDCIWLDLEHRSFDNHQVQTLLAFCRMYDIDCMVRPSITQSTQLYRYLEDGATGLMIPHVSTEERARSLVESVKFPPLGNRGLDGAGLDTEYMLQGGTSYPEEANAETFLVVQIETPQAIEAVEAIAAIDGVDGLFIGTGDLGLRLKCSKSAMSLEDAIDIVASAAKKHGKAWGCPMLTVDNMRDFSRRGAQLISHGGDFLGLKLYLESLARDFVQAEIG